MKFLIFNFMFTFFIFFISAKLFCKESSFIEKSSLELNFSTDFEFSEPLAGIKLCTPFLEAKLSTQNNNFTYGLTLTSESLFKNTNLLIRYGNLSAGGSLSKINSPLLQNSTSPFSLPSTDVTILSTSLPGYSNFSNPETFFSQFLYSNKNKIFQQGLINIVLIPQKQKYVFSLKGKLNFSKRIKVQTAFAGGFLHFDENNIASWFTDDDFFYHEDSIFAFLFQNSLQIDKFNLLATINSYESPFGDFKTLFKFDSKVNIKQISFNFSSLCNTNDNLISGSQKSISESLQFKSGFQFQIPAGKSFPLFLKSGINIYSSYNQKKNQEDVKITAGVQLSSLLFSFSLIPGFNLHIVSDNSIYAVFDSASLKLSGSWYFSNLIPSLAFTATLSSLQDFSTFSSSEKITFNMNFQRQCRISLSNTLNFTQKNGESTKKTFSGSINLKFSAIKKINCIGKLTVVIEF